MIDERFIIRQLEEEARLGAMMERMFARHRERSLRIHVGPSQQRSLHVWRKRWFE